MDKADGHVVRGRDLPAVSRTLLIREGFLLEILKGWYFFQKPDCPTEPTVMWREGFWHFLNLHLISRGGYCLGPENSLDLHSGHRDPPRHATALLTSGGNNTVWLRLGGTDMSCKLLTYRALHPADVEIIDGVRTMPAGYALARVSPRYFQNHRGRIEHILQTTPAQMLAAGILEANVEAGAMRILGALLATGLDTKAEEVRTLIARTGWVRAVNPFGPDRRVMTPIVQSTFGRNIKNYWQEMRMGVLENFPPLVTPLSPEQWQDRARGLLTMDAYHAMSMNGYELSPVDVEKIAAGENPQRLDPKTCLAVMGYLGAHACVLYSIQQNFADNARGSHLITAISKWDDELHKPTRASPLGAAETESVGVSTSEDMQMLADLIEGEPSASVRAILSHVLVLELLSTYENRHAMARFVLNALFATERYPWTILRVGGTQDYLTALEKAPTDILPLVTFIRDEMNNRWE